MPDSTPPDLEALGLAAGAVAHDFDNALMAIINHAALIRAQAGDHAVVAHAEAILRVARGAGRVVERVRGLVRKGGPAPHERLDLATLLREVVDLTVPRAQDKRIEVALSVPTIPFATCGDSAEMTQALGNLVHNAIDAARSRVTITGTNDGVVTISDDGHGIPAELQDRIFEPYFTTRGDGTGLGLPSAQRTIQQHGGRLELASSDAGTTATLTLRRLESESDLAAPRPITDLDLRRAQSDARVLVIDDSVETREALATLFSAAGYQPIEAGDAETALKLFHAERPHLVVSDLKLGTHLAYGLIERISVLGPDVPILIVTGLTQPERPARLKRVAAAIFEKPFSPARLLETARRILNEREAFNALRRSQT